MQPVSVFAARSSVVGLLTSAVMLILLGVFSFFGLRYGGQGLDRFIAPGIAGVFGAVVLFFAVIAPTMKYTVTDFAVIASCGPFKWTIPIDSIQSIVQKDLRWLPWSEGWKIPGLALLTIRYGDVGAVTMCSTSLTRHILVLETRNGLFGITPADEKGFVAAVESRRGK